MKTITAALDGLKFSQATVDYAVHLAHRANAAVTGVFLEDFTYHGYTLFDMVGSRGVSHDKIAALMARDKALRTASVDAFNSACEKEFIAHKTRCRRESAMHELLAETVYADLLLISAQETFSHFYEEKPTSFVRDLLAAAKCPVMVLPKTYADIERVVILFDGKPSSVFAMKLFAYLMPFLAQGEVTVVSVLPDDGNKSPQATELLGELVSSNFPNAAQVVRYGRPHKEIPAYLADVKNALAVLGAYDRSQASMWLKESLADVLLERTDLPLFIAHHK